MPWVEPEEVVAMGSSGEILRVKGRTLSPEQMGAVLSGQTATGPADHKGSADSGPTLSFPPQALRHPSWGHGGHPGVEPPPRPGTCPAALPSSLAEWRRTPARAWPALPVKTIPSAGGSSAPGTTSSETRRPRRARRPRCSTASGCGALGAGRGYHGSS